MSTCRGLNSWVKKLSQQDMPAVGAVISELSALAGRDDSDANQLAEVILRDANLTSHVLRIANSVHYNYSSYPITTVSRAIVLIGFKGMRAICISSLVIDSFLRRGPRERLLQLMARAFQAATQARNLMLQREDERAEEVFIAALLYHLGEMAFWASDSQLRDNEQLQAEDPTDRQDAVEEALGTSFKAITLELARQWRLGETLEQALYPKDRRNPPIAAVLMGEKLSRLALESWQSDAINRLIDEIAEFVDLAPEDARVMVEETAERAVDVARTYGAEAVCRLIPGRISAALDSASESGAPEPLTGDPRLQLSILRELSMAAADIGDANAILQMVTEGMHRGIGLPRVAIGFIRKDRLQAKYALGDGTDHWRDRFNFDVAPDAENFFVSTLGAEDTCWLRKDEVRKHPEWHTPVMTEVLGRHEAFAGALHLSGRRVGIFYADARGLPLTQEQFDSFRHFVSQAQMNLLLLSQSRTRNPGAGQP